MILGVSISTLSMLASKRLEGLAALFLATTVLTSVTGFFLSSDHRLPSRIVGIISLAVVAVALLTLYVYRPARPWRWLFVGGAGLVLYLNVFVLPLLQPLVRAQSEPPFLVARLLVLAVFMSLGLLAAKRLRSGMRLPA